MGWLGVIRKCKRKSSFGSLEISWQFQTCLGGLLSFVCLLESFLVMGGMPHLTGVGVIKGSV